MLHPSHEEKCADHAQDACWNLESASSSTESKNTSFKNLSSIRTSSAARLAKESEAAAPAGETSDLSAKDFLLQTACRSLDSAFAGTSQDV